MFVAFWPMNHIFTFALCLYAVPGHSDVLLVYRSEDEELNRAVVTQANLFETLKKWGRYDA